MKNRFTHNSRFGRHSISEKDRTVVYNRDNFTCQYCFVTYGLEKLSIDHLVPVTRGGLHEIRNYVTCCRSCNSSKRNMPLTEFAKKIKIDVLDLPIHGDPIIDNTEIPIQIRMLRKKIFESIRIGEIEFKGKSAQQKIEKKFRSDVWETQLGKDIIEQFPNLPGHVRIMLPEIETIATSKQEFALLIELAKSGKTRNLIGNEIIKGSNVKETVFLILKKTKDSSLQKRLKQALERTENNTQ